MKAKPGDYITADIKYKTIKDSVFFEGRRRLQITEPSFPGAIDECFLMLAEGEMASFIISANDFFKKTLETTLPAFIHIEDPMIVDIDVIDILTEREYLKEKEAFFCIEDNGPGIPDDIQDLIFKGHTSKKDGQGLGLPGSKAIVDRHEGRIEFFSEPGKGAVFSVFLPLA